MRLAMLCGMVRLQFGLQPAKADVLDKWHYVRMWHAPDSLDPSSDSLLPRREADPMLTRRLSRV